MFCPSDLWWWKTFSQIKYKHFSPLSHSIRFCLNYCNFSKAVCVNLWNHSNGNKSLIHSHKFFFQAVLIFQPLVSDFWEPVWLCFATHSLDFSSREQPTREPCEKPISRKVVNVHFAWEVTCVCICCDFVPATSAFFTCIYCKHYFSMLLNLQVEHH